MNRPSTSGSHKNATTNLKKLRCSSCFVPKCPSNSVKFPNKLFVNGPSNPELREKWFKAAMRDDHYSSKTIIRCCEDHFDLESDIENWMKFKLIGGRVFLKKGVVPHYFDCQNRMPKIKSEIIKENEPFKIIENKNSETQNHSNTDSTSSQSINRIKVVPMVPYRKILPKRPTTATTDIANAIGTYAGLRKVQLTGNQSNNRDGLASGAPHIPLLSGSQMVKQSSDESEHIEVYSHNTPQEQANLTNSQRTPIRQNCHETIHSSDGSSYEYDTGTESSSESSSDEDHKPPNDKICHITVHRIMAKPMLYLGIPPCCSLILQFLQQQLKCKFHHICLVLKKLRLNESFAILADDFDLHESTACSIFSRSCRKLAAILKKFIIQPSRSSVLANLPINFRNFHLETYYLIDCLEIEIEAPIDSVQQTQTYSSLKNCNTMKYLVSATPDGIINFVSDGFGGRTSDLTIFKESKIINVLPPGASIMVHRGFKHIEGVLAKNQLQLIRPPSVNGLKQTSPEVFKSKEIENPWTHIEIIIQRLQEFCFLKPHACLDHYLIPNLDHAMTICCALLNLQSPLIKTEIPN